MIPIEYVSSGVPVMCSNVPGIRVVKDKLGVELEAIPFFDIDLLKDNDFSISEFMMWYDRVNKSREKFSKVIGDYFSIENIDERIISDLSNIIDHHKQI